MTGRTQSYACCDNYSPTTLLAVWLALKVGYQRPASASIIISDVISCRQSLLSFSVCHVLVKWTEVSLCIDVLLLLLSSSSLSLSVRWNTNIIHTMKPHTQSAIFLLPFLLNYTDSIICSYN